MSVRADGSIIIDAKINTEKASKQLEQFGKRIVINSEKASSQMLQLENKIVKTADRISELTNKMQQMKDAKIPTEEYSKLQKELDSAVKKYEELVENVNAFARTNTDKDFTPFKQARAEAQDLYMKIEDIRGAMFGLEESGKAFTLGKDTEKYSALAQKLKYTNNEMNVLCRRHEELEEKQKKNTKEYSRMGKIAGSTSKKAGSFLKSLTSGFKGLNKHVKTGNGLFGQMGTRLKGLALSLLVFNWISKGWNAMISGMKEGIQNLAKHSDEFNSSMSELKSATEQAKNALATAFAPVISALIPYITSFINVITSACDAVARFFAFLSGKTTYTKAKKQNVDYAKSVDGITDSAKEAKDALGSLASFDELNVVSQNKNDSGSGSGDDLGSGGSGDMFEEVPIGDISDWMKRLKEAILAGDWYSVGAIIGEKLTEAMNGIDWDTVYAGAAAFGVGLALFLNGLISPELFGALGRTIAGVLNTVLYAAFAFSENFDFTDAGNSLAALINGFFSTFDFKVAGKTVSNLAKGFLALFIAAIKETKWYQIGNNIAEFLTNIDWAGILGGIGVLIVSALIGVFDLGAGLYSGLADSFANISWDTLGKDFINYLCSVDWVGLLGSFADFLISVFIANFNLAKGLYEFFDSLRTEVYANLDAMWEDNELNSIWDTFKEGAAAAKQEAADNFKQFGTDVSTTLKGVGSKISSWYTNDVSPWFTKEKWSNLADNMKTSIMDKWNATKEEWKTSISGWWSNNVSPWFTKEKWQTLGTKMKQGIVAGFKGAVNSIVDILNSIIGSAEKFINKIADGVNSFLEGVNSSAIGEALNLDMSVGTVSMGRVPYLADGAVIRGGSPFLAVLGDQPGGQTNIETPLGTMVDAFKQAYAEMGADMGGEYTFIAQLEGRTLFKETVRQDRLHKKSSGRSQYA